MSYFVFFCFSYLHDFVSFSGLITFVEEERAYFSAIVYM